VAQVIQQRRSTTPRRPAAIAAAATLVALVALGCRGPAATDEKAAGESTPSPVLAVSAARAVVMPMRQEATLLGTTAALRHLTVRAPSSGRVLGLELQSGDRVRRGEVIAHIINREEEAAQAGVDVARRIDPTEAATLENSVKRYASGSGIPVVAPESAVVAQRLVSPGQLVNNLDPLVDLVDPASTYVEAQVPIDALGAIKPGMDATVTSPLSPGTRYPARVVALSPSFATGGTVAPARVAFTGKERIAEAGAAVEVHVTTAYAPAALAIPGAGLFQDAARGGYYVFTVGRDGRAHRVPVTLGMRQGDRVQVTSGLRAGDLVITSGGYALSDGLAIEVETLAEHHQ
jgi:multidrug efflux pump subunit AcrA (membrane-fusion protein)